MPDDPIPSRPRLTPPGGWARWTLIALLLLTLLRGGLWATTTPNFWGPDEDYHAMYADQVAREHRVIDRKYPLYSLEYSRTLDRTEFNVYGSGGIRAFSGDPKASIAELARLPESERQGSQIGRGIGVVHPPGYYVLAGAVDATMLDKALPTRLWWMRMVSGLFGVLAVYGTWLLGSVVFRRSRALPLMAATLVALQPMIAFLSGLVSNDAPVIATFTLAMAMLAFLCGTAPRARQGLWLGLAIGLAMAMKATALALLPLAAVTLVFQGLTYGRWREIGRSALLAGGVLAVVIGWWYVHSRLAYHSFTGEIIAPVPDSPGGAAPAVVAKAVSFGIGDYISTTRLWLADAYKTGWFHYLNFEAPGGHWFYFLPGGLTVIAALGVAGLLWTRRAWARAAEHPLVRQIVVLALATPALMLPFLVQDVRRVADGSSFLTNAGRFVLPAYPSAVVVALCGIAWLTSRQARPLAFGAITAGAAWFCWYVWSHNYADRYFGKVGLGEQLRRMSFDRPEFVTQTTLTLVIALIVASAAAVATGLLVLARRETRPDGDAAAELSPSG